VLRSQEHWKRGLRNCADPLYSGGVNRFLRVNKINDLATEKTGGESCRPSQFQLKLLISLLSNPKPGRRNEFCLQPLRGRCVVRLNLDLKALNCTHRFPANRVWTRAPC
jgi:hypothetical protein